jgi:hypothetical protein
MKEEAAGLSRLNSKIGNNIDSHEDQKQKDNSSCSHLNPASIGSQLQIV